MPNDVKPIAPARAIALLAQAYGQPVWSPRYDPLAELLYTILSQNTADTNSQRAFAALRDRFPAWEALAEGEVEDIAEAIKSGGLGNVKAPRLRAVVREIGARRGDLSLGFLVRLPLEEAKAWLRSLPGVGPKTAACVLLFALGRPALPVDTHVARVARRLGLIPERASAENAHGLLEAMLAPEQVYPFHVLLVEHGRRTCAARRPACPRCALLPHCPTGQRLTKGLI